jgi:arylsulfatase A-like enzyme
MRRRHDEPRRGATARALVCAGLVVQLLRPLAAPGESPGAAGCTTRREVFDAGRAAVRGLRCLRHAAPDDRSRCEPPSFPACATDAMTRALAVPVGAAGGPAVDLTPEVRRAQRRCEDAVVKSSERFLWITLRDVLSAVPYRRAHARARAALAAIDRRCHLGVVSGSSVGGECRAAAGAVGNPMDVLGLTACLASRLAPPAEQVAWRWLRPNIILVLTDDQRWDTLQYMPRVRAELVDHGVEFTNAYVTTSLCAPSRASILTGQYASHTGVLTNGLFDREGAAYRFSDASTLATWLKAAGYRTAFFGKYVNGYVSFAPYVPPGWDEWQAFELEKFYDYQLVVNGRFEPHGKTAEDYSTDVLAARVVAYVRAAGDQPFFLQFAPYAPHLPAPPAPRHAGTFADLPPWRPPSYNEADVSDKPKFFAGVKVLTPEAQGDLDAERIDMIESLQAIDEAVGAIMDTLRRTGNERNTMVVFTSDNGHAWGEHRWITKSCPYEECRRVPMVVFYPPLVAEPRRDDHFVENIDLAPTFMALAGSSPGLPQDGRSLLPLLENAPGAWRTDMLGEHWALAWPPTFALVQNARWKYVEYVGGDRELYDLAADPYEMTSVASDPGHADTVAAMAARLRELEPGWPPPSVFPERPLVPAIAAPIRKLPGPGPGQALHQQQSGKP